MPVICPLCHSQSTKIIYRREDVHLGWREYALCENCQLIFLLPECRLSPDQEKARYDLHQNSPDDADYRKFLNRLLDPLCGRLKPGFKGLDYGCGPGPTVSVILKEKGFSVEDYDPFYFPRKELLNKQYDFVTCSETAEHFFNPRREFHRLSQLLKSGNSMLAVMTQLRDEQSDFADWWYHQEPTHVSFYHPTTMRWIADWLGWRFEFPADNVVLFMNEETGK